MKFLAAISTLVVLAATLAGCHAVVNGGTCRYESLAVSPATATADHAAIPPGNGQQFLAFGRGLTAGCAAVQSNLPNVTWTVSDAVNVTISNAADTTSGVATCKAATAGPVTVTATLPADKNSGLMVSGTGSLTCR